MSESAIQVDLVEHCRRCAEIVKTWPTWKQEWAARFIEQDLRPRVQHWPRCEEEKL